MTDHRFDPIQSGVAAQLTAAEHRTIIWKAVVVAAALIAVRRLAETYGKDLDYVDLHRLARISRTAA